MAIDAVPVVAPPKEAIPLPESSAPLRLKGWDHVALSVPDLVEAERWYVDVLGAEVVLDPIVMDDGRIGHVELAVGIGRWMMSDVFEGVGIDAPDTSRGAAVSLHLEVDDVDAVCARVTGAGVVLDRGLEDNPPVGRVAVFRDPFGHRWFLNQPLRGR